MSILSDNLKKVRAFHGFSQTKAAALIGVKRSLYASWEESRAKPSVTTFPAVVQAFGITDWVGFLSNEKFDIRRQNPTKTKDELILSNYKKLDGVLKEVADFLLKRH